MDPRRTAIQSGEEVEVGFGFTVESETTDGSLPLPRCGRLSPLALCESPPGDDGPPPARSDSSALSAVAETNNQQNTNQK